jgi:hypothetical protein
MKLKEQSRLIAGCYCRLSDDDEKDGTSISIETQRKILTEYCKEHGIQVYDVYEDDGFTFDYELGKYAETPLSLKKSKDGYTLTVGKREGSFEGRPDNDHNIYVNSIPKIDGIPEIKDMKIRIFDEGIKSVTLNGNTVEFERNGGFVEFVMPKKLHEQDELCYEIEL